MNRLVAWLVRIFGIPVLTAIARRVGAAIRLKIRKAKNQKLREDLQKADTPEERDEATKAIVDQFNASDK